MTYQKPAVQRLGSLREVTLGAGQNTPGDATNLYHRYKNAKAPGDPWSFFVFRLTVKACLPGCRRV